MLEMVYGKNTVIELIKANHKIKEILISEQIYKNSKELLALIDKNKIKFQVIDKKTLNNIVDGNHQGIIAKIEPFKYFSIEDILNEAKKRNEKPFIIILDGLMDPHNLGAILRTADACGVHGIIIPKNRSVSLNSTVAKLSTGAINYVKVAKVTNLSNTIKELKKNNIWVIGTDIDTNLDYRKMSANDAIAIVIGNEGKGISRLVKENCDLLIKLPMKGRIGSLNASVATSIIMYEVLNQRNPLK